MPSECSREVHRDLLLVGAGFDRRTHLGNLGAPDVVRAARAGRRLRVAGIDRGRDAVVRKAQRRRRLVGIIRL